MCHIYQNPAYSPEERALDLLSRMTVEEKVGQMTQISYSCVTPKEAEEWVAEKFAGSVLHVLGDDARHLQALASNTRLGIPLLFGIDAIHGHALNNGATVFPSPLAMSCSWNPQLIEEAGRVTAKEVTADGLHWTFSPLLCIGRDLRWGRIDETFGEDPYLIGILASAIIRGYQGKNLSDPDSILACAKHYLAYGESTGGRDAYDAEASIRKIREIFLPPFKRAIDAGCATVMSGYQSIDGTPVTASKKLLREILKEELGFNGFVVTDWDNTGSLISNQKVAVDMHDASLKAVEAGNDMIMNTPDFYVSAIKLVNEKILPESLIDEAVKRILHIKFSLGLFDRKKNFSGENTAIIGCTEHNDVNLRLTRESMVLLENRRNTLPLDKQIKRIAVIGPNADHVYTQFGDWTFFSHPYRNPEAIPQFTVHTMLKGIQDAASQRAIEVVCHKGCDVMNRDDRDIQGAVETAATADVVVAVVGDHPDQYGEFRDRADLNLSGAQQELLERLKECGKPLVVVLVNGKPLSIPWIAQNADAVIETFNPGALGGKVLAEILFGEINPSGRLSISFPYHSGQLPVYYNQLPGWHGGKYIDMPAEPLYSFGYGLSYTQFKYSNLRLSHTVCKKEDNIVIRIDVANVGNRDGIETVQLYVHDTVSSVVTPVKQLKGFARVELKTGETKTVEIPLSVTELAIVDAEENYIVEPGDFVLMVGPDSRDEVLLKATLTVA